MSAPTLLEILQKTAAHFQKKGISTYRLDAQLLLGHVLNLDRVGLYLHYDRPLTEAEVTQSRELVRRRALREPLQHIIGKTSFRELDLKIDKRALIPRRETEIIVDLAKKCLEGLPAPIAEPSILDLGVGSGAIFLSLKKEIPAAHIDGVDLSPEALALANENAARNGLDGSGLVQGDAFAPFGSEKRWHLILSNPPYVSRAEFEGLEPEVKVWDPAMALIAGESGMEFGIRLLEEAKNRLLPGCYLLMEIGCGQATELMSKAKDTGWSESRVERDYSEKDRFLICKT